MTEYFPLLSGLLLTATLVISTLSMSASKSTYRLAWSLVVAMIVLDVIGFTTPLPGIFIGEAIVLSSV